MSFLGSFTVKVARVRVFSVIVRGGRHWEHGRL